MTDPLSDLASLQLSGAIADVSRLRSCAIGRNGVRRYSAVVTLGDGRQARLVSYESIEDLLRKAVAIGEAVELRTGRVA